MSHLPRIGTYLLVEKKTCISIVSGCSGSRQEIYREVGSVVLSWEEAEAEEEAFTTSRVFVCSMRQKQIVCSTRLGAS